VTSAFANIDPLFNQLTPEAWGVWRWIESTNDSWEWRPLTAMYKHCRDNGMLCTQHPFFWGEVLEEVPTGEPEWVWEPGNNRPAATLQADVRQFLSEYMRLHGQDMSYAVVVNEFMHAPTTFRAKIGGDNGIYGTGWDWVVWAFEEARKAADLHESPVKFILNEYGVLGADWQFGPDGTIDGMIQVANVLKARGLVDAVGCQSHFLETATAALVQARLDRLSAEVGLPIYITEFDLNIANDALQQSKMEALFPVFWNHPSVCGVTLWAIRQGQSTWKPNTYLIRSDGTDRPAMAWLRNYVANNPATPCAFPTGTGGTGTGGASTGGTGGTGTGGASTGGTGGTGTGGASTGGTGGAPAAGGEQGDGGPFVYGDSENGSGCACRAASTNPGGLGRLLLGLSLLLSAAVARGRRRARQV
jgi:endo-1,4-beta-xylanase